MWKLALQILEVQVTPGYVQPLALLHLYEHGSDACTIYASGYALNELEERYETLPLPMIMRFLMVSKKTIVSTVKKQIPKMNQLTDAPVPSEIPRHISLELEFPKV